MRNVLQLTRKLSSRPERLPVAGILIRNFMMPDDLHPWLELRNRSFARQRLGVRAWGQAEFAAEFLEKPWWHPSRMWLAVEEASQTLAGSVTLAERTSSTSSKPVVHWLMVAPRFRRRGIARQLMATLEQTLWDSGARQLWLETHTAWHEATHLYHALGYSETD